MPRATNAPASNKRRKRIMKQARGFYGGRSKLYRTAKESVDHAMAHNYEHRKQKKRNYRRLWNIRINAACRENNLSYSRFIEGIRKAEIDLNRKMLAEIAVNDPHGFAKLVDTAREHCG